MWWLIKGPWAIVKWVWAGIVLFFYGLFALLSILTWFDAEPTVYNNNLPRGKAKPPEPKEDKTA
jgi:hypothetical protein